MVTINNRLTRFPWYGQPLALSGAPFVGNVNVIRVVNVAGTGFNSFKPGALNSYPTANVGDVLELDAKNLPAGGFQLDNGVPPGSGASDTGVFVCPAGNSQTLFTALVASRFQFAAPIFTAGAGSVDISLSGGPYQSWSAFNASLAALTDAQIQAASIPFTVRVAQTNNTAATVEIAVN